MYLPRRNCDVFTWNNNWFYVLGYASVSRYRSNRHPESLIQVHVHHENRVWAGRLSDKWYFAWANIFDIRSLPKNLCLKLISCALLLLASSFDVICLCSVALLNVQSSIYIQSIAFYGGIFGVFLYTYA